jgi:hypothetical protein
MAFRSTHVTPEVDLNQPLPGSGVVSQAFVLGIAGLRFGRRQPEVPQHQVPGDPHTFSATMIE